MYAVVRAVIALLERETSLENRQVGLGILKEFRTGAVTAWLELATGSADAVLRCGAWEALAARLGLESLDRLRRALDDPELQGPLLRGLRENEGPVTLALSLAALDVLEVRDDVADILALYGAAACSALLHALATGSTEVRIGAIAVLGELGSHNSEFQAGAGAVAERLRDFDPRIRGEAALALGRMGRIEVLQVLAQALRDSEARVRSCAAFGLAQIPASESAPQVVPALLESLNDPDSGVRLQAAVALISHADSRALPGLRAGLRDVDFRIRDACATALARIANHEDAS
ncbi:MAG: HEAT repeat domain-containing protein [Armatimonadetes bacterium]|nr:HEAT repeat domain-containing protein [Armatimonadota bacterium]